MPTASAVSTTPSAAAPAGGAPSLGHELATSPALKQAVDAIVREVEAKRAQITDVRGPRSPEATASYEDLLKRAGEVRGRALLYPFIGSGLGNGALVELADGSVKWDMITAIGVNFFGHSEPDLVRTALMGSASDIVMQGHLLTNNDAHRFAAMVLDEAKRCSRLSHIFLANAGVMANENALKICFQKHAPASRVLAFAHNFMGRTVTMSQIGDSPANREGLPLSTLVDYMPFFDGAAAKRMSAGDASGTTRYIDMAVQRLREFIERYPKQHAAFIFELVQGEGGFNVAPPEFHRALMRVCRDAGIAVWADEVQTFGRTTSMFCFDALGLGDLVDVVTIGKLPQVCATLFTSDYNPKPGLMSATFLGSTDAIRVGTRIVERLRDGDYYGPGGRIAKHQKAFREGMKAIEARHPEWFAHDGVVADTVDGFGGLMRFTPFGGAKDPVMKACRALYDEGVIVFYCGHGPYHVRMLPPLGVMKLEDWPRVLALVESGLGKVAGALDREKSRK
jgi:4-aminobutyrate aminotransferase-like enzyme